MLFHEDMQAEVRIGVGVRNGLHLGCILAPALISLFFSVMVSTWRTEVGVDVLLLPWKEVSW